MKSIKLFVYFLTAVISPGLGQEMPPCSMSVEDGMSWSYFEQHGVNVPSYDLYVFRSMYHVELNIKLQRYIVITILTIKRWFNATFPVGIYL